MITSALIGELRREYGDQPKSVKVSRQADGQITLFNVGKYPIVEGSYQVYFSGIVRTSAEYTLDLDSGDLNTTAIQANGVVVSAQLQYAQWRDKNWLEAINNAVQDLNARGFFKQVVRNTSIFRLSANVQTYTGPSACVDLYELLVLPAGLTSGSYTKPYVNWSYQQDGNKVVVGNRPTVAQRAAISYLRNMKTFTATSATLDVLDDWLVLLKKKSGSNFYRSLAGKIAKQGNATVDEGHFSFTNARTMANDLDDEYERLALRKKPTRPAKDMQFHDPNGGVA